MLTIMVYLKRGNCPDRFEANVLGSGAFKLSLLFCRQVILLRQPTASPIHLLPDHCTHTQLS